MLCLVVLVVAGCSTPVEDVPEPVPVPVVAESEPVQVVDQPQDETNVVVSSGDISILGARGLEPDSLTVRAGSSVSFTNNNPSEIDNYKDIVLVIQNKYTRLTEHSGKLSLGETYEHVFTTAGTFDFWTVGYGIKGTITVE